MASYAAIIGGANATIGTGNNAPSNSNDAYFRGWTQMVANGFISAGWTRATDTGNINFGTVSTPATATFSAGYDIFQMADALQATAPVFAKIEYGSSAVADTAPSLWVTVGSGSNGSGSLTGPLSTRFTINAAAQSTNAISSFISGDTNRIQMALWSFSNTTMGNTVYTGGAATEYLSIERTKDATGADTNEGVLIVIRTRTDLYQQYWNSLTGATGVEGPTNGWGCLMPTPNIGTTTGVQSSFYPLYHSKGVFLNPGMGTLCFVGSPTAGFAPLATEGAPIVIPIYGSNHTYIPMGAALCNTVSARAGANSTFVMRFE